MKTNLIIVLLAAIFISGCSDQPPVKGTNSAAETDVNMADNRGMTVNITPSEATADSVIMLHFQDRSPGKLDINWVVNGETVESVKGLRFSSPALRKGDIVQAVINKDDEKYYSNSITIKNTPPVILRARLNPDIPVTSSMLTVDVSTDDIDRDVVALDYGWYINGNFAGNRNYLDEGFHRGDKIEVEITPYDKEDSGNKIRIKCDILNAAPVFSESAPTLEGQVYTYRLDVTDPDGDPLTYKLEKGPEGMAIDPGSGIITWNVGSKNEGEHEVEVLISDNLGAKLLVPFSTRIGIREPQ